MSEYLAISVNLARPGLNAVLRHMGYQMVTWPMTSRDPQRCCEAVRTAILATARLLVHCETISIKRLRDVRLEYESDKAISLKLKLMYQHGVVPMRLTWTVILCDDTFSADINCSYHTQTHKQRQTHTYIHTQTVTDTSRPAHMLII